MTATPMLTRHTRAPKDNKKSLDAFIAAKADIDAMLTRLQAASADHFGTAPEDIHWGHVGNLTDYAALLRRITDAVFQEGEHAE